MPADKHSFQSPVPTRVPLASVPAEAMERVARRLGLTSPGRLPLGDPLDSLPAVAKAEEGLSEEVRRALPLRLMALVDTLEDGALPEYHVAQTSGINLPLPRGLLVAASRTPVSAQSCGLRFDRNELRACLLDTAA